MTLTDDVDAISEIERHALQTSGICSDVLRYARCGPPAHSGGFEDVDLGDGSLLTRGKLRKQRTCLPHRRCHSASRAAATAPRLRNRCVVLPYPSDRRDHADLPARGESIAYVLRLRPKRPRSSRSRCTTSDGRRLRACSMRASTSSTSRILRETLIRPRRSSASVIASWPNSVLAALGPAVASMRELHSCHTRARTELRAS